MVEKTITVAVYARTNGHEGDEVNQVAQCIAYVTEHIGDNCNITVYEDEGQSNNSFNEMISNQHQYDYVVTYSLNLIADNVIDLSSILNGLTDKGTILICLKEQFDCSAVVGKALMRMVNAFAELEREIIEEG